MYTVKKAAEILRLSVSLTYALLAAGRIRHERHGLGRGTIRIPSDALEEYRQAQTVEVTGRKAKPRHYHARNF